MKVRIKSTGEVFNVWDYGFSKPTLEKADGVWVDFNALYYKFFKFEEVELVGE